MSSRSNVSRRLGAVLLVAALAIGAACTRDGNADGDEAGNSRGGAQTQPVGDGDVAAAIEAGDFGTIEEVCGPAPEGETLEATGSVGVTADTVTIGTISDPNNFARPGLNQELFDASTVFVSWCNELGGINGRQIILNQHDAALTRYRAAVESACQSDFFLVGGGGVFDTTGQEERLACMLPTLDAFGVGAESFGADLRVWPFGRNSGSGAGALGRFLADQHPDSVGSVGFLTASLGSINDTNESMRAAVRAQGQTLVYDDQYNAVGEPTWVPYAQKIKESGVRGLYYLGEPHNLGLLIQALAQINYPLDWIAVTPNIYDSLLIETAGDALAAIPVYAEVSAVPFEKADESAAMSTYLGLFERFLPNGKSRTMLGTTSFAAWLMFAQAAKACGAELTRTCVWEEANSIEVFDAGGLYPVAPPVDGRPVGCFVPVKATPDGYVPIDWNINHGVFNCSTENLGGLAAEMGDAFTDDADGPGVKLADVGKTMDDLQ